MKIKDYFKKLETTNEFVSTIGKKYQIAFIDDYDKYYYFDNYKEFENFINDEHNDAKEILNCNEVILAELFTIDWCGSSYSYKITIREI